MDFFAHVTVETFIGFVISSAGAGALGFIGKTLMHHLISLFKNSQGQTHGGDQNSNEDLAHNIRDLHERYELRTQLAFQASSDVKRKRSPFASNFTSAMVFLAATLVFVSLSSIVSSGAIPGFVSPYRDATSMFLLFFAVLTEFLFCSLMICWLFNVSTLPGIKKLAFAHGCRHVSKKSGYSLSPFSMRRMTRNYSHYLLIDADSHKGFDLSGLYGATEYDKICMSTIAALDSTTIIFVYSRYGDTSYKATKTLRCFRNDVYDIGAVDANRNEVDREARVLAYWQANGVLEETP